MKNENFDIQIYLLSAVVAITLLILITSIYIIITANF